MDNVARFNLFKQSSHANGSHSFKLTVSFVFICILVDSGFFEGVKKVLHVGEVEYTDVV